MIHQFIKNLESQGWKQREIASKTGVSQNFISELSHGKKCSIETLLKFADAFGVSTDAVLGRTQEKTLSPVEELLIQTTEGNEQIARAALRSAQGEKSLLKSEGERGKGRNGGSMAA
jgi:transcriptional regulator with XRE-family HTH domain